MLPGAVGLGRAGVAGPAACASCSACPPHNTHLPPRFPSPPLPSPPPSGSNDPLHELPSLHAAPVTAMRYNEPADTVISTDAKGGWVDVGCGMWDVGFGWWG